MVNTKYKSIQVPMDIYHRLVSRKRPHQALAGVIEELLIIAGNDGLPAYDKTTHVIDFTP